MNKRVITSITLMLLVFITLLLVAGCSRSESASRPQLQNSEGKEVVSTSSGEQQSITGGLNEVDRIDSELSDPELDKTGEYIDEVEW